LITKLVKIANSLDAAGQYDLANELDVIISLAANEPPCNCDPVDLIGIGHDPECEYVAWKAAGKPEYKPVGVEEEKSEYGSETGPSPAQTLIQQIPGSKNIDLPVIP
jgi:hypothetical protein